MKKENLVNQAMLRLKLWTQIALSPSSICGGRHSEMAMLQVEISQLMLEAQGIKHDQSCQCSNPRG
jgi:hypothetical protein